MHFRRRTNKKNYPLYKEKKSPYRSKSLISTCTNVYPRQLLQFFLFTHIYAFIFSVTKEEHSFHTFSDLFCNGCLGLNRR